ncbi:CaiB/BaiF CoA transferase family protein [Corynebacterium crudilactis]|uniref:CaiB/BaiF CoA transferase family protein n=1 Tax=Corynebacterium crudilactis TaxID=1652495 RepID=UPI0009EE9674|nr:CaiB/BaiF CoA-transferase family protein [Corynebacterium crudilactis]
MRTGIPVGDLAAGLHAVIGILAALHNVKETGQGEFIDISMLDCLVTMLSYQGTYYLESGAVPGLQGSGHDAIPTYRQFTAGDGRDIVTTANTERMWKAMAEVLGHPELLEDPRFTLNRDRLKNKEALWSIIEPAFLTKEAAEWVRLFNEAGIPVGMVNTLDLALTSPQVLHRDMVVELADDNGTSVKTLGNPIKLSRAPRGSDTFPPALGEHTADILQTVLGKTPEEIDNLLSAGIVTAPLQKVSVD